MKKVLIFVFLLYSTSLLADPWDNLTYKEAENVQASLTASPFILDYCDCCDFSGEYAAKVYLLKVVSTEIVECEWDNMAYSVKATVVKIAELPYTDKGPDIMKPIKSSGTEDFVITMNYTWTISPEILKAVPFYQVLPYGEHSGELQTSAMCRDFIEFPDPFKTKGVITDKDYKEWYKDSFM